MLRFGFTLTRDRPTMYAELVENVLPQLDAFLTVTHGPEAAEYAQGETVHYDRPVLDLSIQWNYGFDWARDLAGDEPYTVACFNDDALIADDWYDRMLEALDRDGSAGASTPRKPGSRKIFGGAFLIRGGLGIRLSGLARWYGSDDEIQYLCEEAGGFTIVPDLQATNRLANQSTRTIPELMRMSNEDRPAFLARYGRAW